MKKLILLAVLLVSGCTTTSIKPLCTAYVKTYNLGSPAYYPLVIRDHRVLGDKIPRHQLKTKYGWWDLSHFSLEYGDCKTKIQ